MGLKSNNTKRVDLVNYQYLQILNEQEAHFKIIQQQNDQFNLHVLIQFIDRIKKILLGLNTKSQNQF
ncbi:hypothetical protein pb186bvf_014733 [Paramecium bursaria]